MVVVTPPEVVVVVVAVPPLAIVFAGVVELVVAVARARYHVPPKATIFSPLDPAGPESPT